MADRKQNMCFSTESNSKAGMINLSAQAAKALLERAPDIKLFPRGKMQIKGKGNMHVRAPLRTVHLVLIMVEESL